MNGENRLSSDEMERVCNCLERHARRACDSTPSPAVLVTIHAAAERKVRRIRILPFVRFAAAAAMLLVTLTGWRLIRSNMASETERQAALMDDMLFLCADDQTVPAAVAPKAKQGNLARRLLNLQGLDEMAVPETEMPAERPAPPSIDSQSRNTPELQGQRCG